MRLAGRARRRAGAGAGPRAAAEHGRDAGGDGLVRLLRADEVDVRVEAAGRDDAALAGNHVGAGADDHGGVSAVHAVRSPGFADADADAFFAANVGFDDAAPVDDERVRDDGVEGLGVRAAAGLAHAFAQRLAAAKLALVAVGREVPFDFDPEVREAEADEVAGCGAKHAAVGFPGHGEGTDVEYVYRRA